MNLFRASLYFMDSMAPKKDAEIDPALRALIEGLGEKMDGISGDVSRQVRAEMETQTSQMIERLEERARTQMEEYGRKHERRFDDMDKRFERIEIHIAQTWESINSQCSESTQQVTGEIRAVAQDLAEYKRTNQHEIEGIKTMCAEKIESQGQEIMRSLAGVEQERRGEIMTEMDKKIRLRCNHLYRNVVGRSNDLRKDMEERIENLKDKDIEELQGKVRQLQAQMDRMGGNSEPARVDTGTIRSSEREIGDLRRDPPLREPLTARYNASVGNSLGHGSEYSQIVNVVRHQDDRPKKFDGKTDITPKRFVKEVREYLREHRISPDRHLRTVGRLLEGPPLKWFQSFEDSFENFDDFQSAFLDRYWGLDKQQNLRMELYLGKYAAGAPSRYAEYFTGQMLKMRDLDPPICETEIVKIIEKQLPADVQRVLIAANVNTAAEMEEVLRRLDQTVHPGGRLQRPAENPICNIGPAEGHTRPIRKEQGTNTQGYQDIRGDSRGRVPWNPHERRGGYGHQNYSFPRNGNYLPNNQHPRGRGDHRNGYRGHGNNRPSYSERGSRGRGRWNHYRGDNYHNDGGRWSGPRRDHDERREEEHHPQDRWRDTIQGSRPPDHYAETTTRAMPREAECADEARGLNPAVREFTPSHGGAIKKNSKF